MMLIAVFAKDNRYSADYIANYANVYVLDALRRVPGAGQAAVLGAADQAMRIWMNPDRMASLGVTTTDIQNAVNQQNALVSAGQIGQQPSSGPVQQTFPVVTEKPFGQPWQYDNIILRANPGGGAIVRLRDVARTEVGLTAVHHRQLDSTARRPRSSLSTSSPAPMAWMCRRLCARPWRT